MPGAEKKGNNMVKAWLMPVGKPGHPVELKPDNEGSYLKALQRQVEGWIEYVPWAANGRTHLIVNEEGLFRCRPNRVLFQTSEMVKEGYGSQLTGQAAEEDEAVLILFGPVLAVAFDETVDEDGCPDEVYRDITEDEIAEVESYCKPAGTPAVWLVKAGAPLPHREQWLPETTKA